MAAQGFCVIFTHRAWDDLEEIVRYWTDRDETERGEQYAKTALLSPQLGNEDKNPRWHSAHPHPKYSHVHTDASRHPLRSG